ncbi:MAG: tRNA pseudouridine(13) synthase TruD [Planctomycetota bacterium]|nr:tRNA pseudouridine(13) synthase TruD [Planctomycetota bacterium]
MPVAYENLAFLTPGTPGIGGAIKQRPEDFLVDEQPLYEPSGTGEHLFLLVEKTGLTTSDVLRRLARVFRVRNSEIGYAGLKDKHAVTRQHFSVRLPNPAHDAELLAHAESPGVRVAWSARHGNKLRRGHLAGNRFVIRIRDVTLASVIGAKAVLDRLALRGVPNYFGDQRFGYRGDNPALGRLLLQGKSQEFLDLMLGQPREQDFPATRAGREAYDRRDYRAALDVWPRHLRHDRQALDALRQGKSADKAVLAIDQQQRDFFVSGLQSAVFNEVLHQRIVDTTFDRILPGDLAWKHDNRSVFAVDDATAELENGPEGRVPRLEVSPSGPMWGTSMTMPTGAPADAERRALAALAVTEAELAGGPFAKAEGSRRPLRIPITNIDVTGGGDEHGPYVRLAFDLPRGSFATTVLREIMKTKTQDPDPPPYEPDR